MATTWIRPTHARTNSNNRAIVKRSIDYITDKEKTFYRCEAETAQQENILTIKVVNNYLQNPNKTENNELVTGYECTPEIADEEFANSMQEYEIKTKRTHKDNSRLLYHMRQSFKPGEVDAEVANRIGYELALEFTKGQHAFVVATHTDKNHFHNHIIFNAFNLECDGKFKDPYYNYRDVARISDNLCKQYELSVIDVRHGWSDPYKEWERKNRILKTPTAREQLENVIDISLDKRPKDFDQLLEYLEMHDCFAKRRGSNISVTTPFSKRSIRLSSLSEQYTEQGIKKQLEEQQKNPFNKYQQMEENVAQYPPPKKLQLIIDIENSLKATESIGYRKWAEKFNLQQMSQTLLLIERYQFTFEQLKIIATENQQRLQIMKNNIIRIDKEQQHISELQRHIGTYGKTKEVYAQYKKNASPERLRQENMKAIIDHEAAKAYFNKSGYGFGSGNKLPSINQLREQYATLNTDKKEYEYGYKELKNNSKETENAWQNVKAILNYKVENVADVSTKEIKSITKEPTKEPIKGKPKRKSGPSL